jgi:hypothetical protein
MKCVNCGNQTFRATRHCCGSEAVIVDSSGRFLRALTVKEVGERWLDDDEPALEFGEPEGPFACERCGAEWRGEGSLKPFKVHLVARATRSVEVYAKDPEEADEKATRHMPLMSGGWEVAEVLEVIPTEA